MGKSLVALLVDIAAPLGGYYLLRAFDVPPIWALTLSGLPPALRVLYLAVRHRRSTAWACSCWSSLGSAW